MEHTRIWRSNQEMGKDLNAYHQNLFLLGDFNLDTR